MRIGLNLLYLLPSQVGGTETYAVELMRALDTGAPDDEFLVFVNAESAKLPIPSGHRFRRIICPVRAANRMMRYLYEQFVLPFQVLWHRVDLLHSLGYVGPILPLHKHLITIHDANFVRLSHLMSPLKRIVYGLIVRLSAKTCSHVVTVSSFSKAELEECLELPSTKVSVTLSGAPIMSQRLEQTGLAGVFASHQPYILVLGGGSPHKNIRAFVQAFGSVAERFPHKLLIAGRLNDSLDDLPVVSQLIQSGRIVISGFLGDAELDQAYRGATLYVFPTLYEGFGLPLLEAQARGVPVLCSRIASLPELGGDSVAYLDPSSIEDMAKQLENLLSHPAQLQNLTERGKANVQRFTWEQTAVQTQTLYRQILG